MLRSGSSPVATNVTMGMLTSSNEFQDSPLESRIDLGRAIGNVVKWDKERAQLLF